MLTRLPQWDTQLFHNFIIENAQTPFAWGTNDCCLMPANAILAFTGTDIADDFRTGYKTKKAAFSLLSKVTGGTTVADAAAYCAKKHGLDELVHPLLAQRGDLVVINNTDNLIAAIVHLNGREVISVSDTGLVTLPITSIVRAWRV